WYQWDPTKWLIAFLGFTRLARNLRRTPQAAIEAARLRLKTAKALRAPSETVGPTWSTTSTSR
ncbi:MAG TPA: hypothetical protein VFS34_03135, partial [Thermoanaerobaculia bacterium]|nr:hypothetical protein [Thermoanaerobaculia bacterium]